MSYIQGNPDLVEQPVVRGHNAQSGRFIQRSWRGTEDACNGGLEEVITTGGHDSAEVNGDGAAYTLSVRYAIDPIEPSDEVPVHEERLHYNEITKSIYEHPNYAGLSFSLKASIREAVQSNATASPAELQNSPAGQELYELLLEGVESFIVRQPVVIVTDTASRGYAWNIGFTNVGLIFTTADMIADAGLSSGWVNNLINEAAITGYHSGWLKGPPEVTTVGGNRSQLVREYTFGRWSTALYQMA